MAHERHANFLHDSGFHQARIEGVAKIVEADVSDSGIFQRRFPGPLNDANGPALVIKDQSLWLAMLKQMLRQAPGQGNFPGLPFGSFRTCDEQQLAREVNILPALVGDLAAPHAGVEGHDDHDV